MIDDNALNQVQVRVSQESLIKKILSRSIQNHKFALMNGNNRETKRIFEDINELAVEASVVIDKITL